MSKLYQLEAYRNKSSRTFFERSELDQLLSLYSRRVASGEWRDYAIDQVGSAAIFSVFRHTHDAPLFAIAKQRSKQGRLYTVFSGRQKLARSQSLPDALKVFRKHLKVIT
ncbi:MAG: DUF2794 domain-containing protein [Pseudomonadota bacterium]